MCHTTGKHSPCAHGGGAYCLLSTKSCSSISRALSPYGPHPPAAVLTRGANLCAEEGADLENKTLEPGIKEQLVQYGELVQAAYDNLGLDRCAPNYGNALVPPADLLEYTQGNYRVAEGKEGPVQSTYDRCASSALTVDKPGKQDLHWPDHQAHGRAPSAQLQPAVNVVHAETVLVRWLVGTGRAGVLSV